MPCEYTGDCPTSGEFDPVLNPNYGLLGPAPVLGGEFPVVILPPDPTMQLAHVPLSPAEVLAQIGAAREREAKINTAVAESLRRTDPSLLQRAANEAKAAAVGLGDAFVRGAGRAAGGALDAAESGAQGAGGLVGGAAAVVRSVGESVQSTAARVGLGVGLAAAAVLTLVIMVKR